MNAKNKWFPASTKAVYAFALAPLSALAAPPIGFDGWAVSSGNISAGCPSGFECTMVGASPGFMQRSVTDSITGRAYIQTVVTSKSATGSPLGGSLTFSDEGFVKQGQGTDVGFGIAAKQAIKLTNSTATGLQQFDSLAIINTGWAATAGVPSIDVTQRIHEVANPNKVFDATTVIQSNNDQNGNQIGLRLSYDTVFTQPLNTDQGNGDDKKGSSTVRDTQAVSIRQVGGNMLTAGGSASLTNGQGISWQPGQTVTAMWAGGLMTHTDGCKREDFPRGRCMLGQGLQSLDNKNDNNQISLYFQFGAAGPFSWWDNPFGPRPAMPNVPVGDTSGKD